MTKKRIKTLLLFAAFAICAIVAPQTAFATEQTTIDVSTSSEFNDAVSTVNAATSGEYTIRLANDIEGGAPLSTARARQPFLVTATQSPLAGSAPFPYNLARS